MYALHYTPLRGERDFHCVLLFCSCASRLVLSRSSWTSDIPQRSRPPRPSTTFGGCWRSSSPPVTIKPNQSSSRASRRTPCRFAHPGRKSRRTPAPRRIARQRARARRWRFLKMTPTRSCTKCGMCVFSPFPPLAVQSRVSRTPLTPCLSGYVEVPRVPRISPADAAVHSALHRGWFLHQRGRRFMGVCRSVCSQCSIIPQCADENRYEKRKRRTTPVTETYHFIGYSSLYPFYCFPDKVRLRLRSASLFFFACKRLTLTLFPANS